jgi:hypothetical protein
VRRLWIHGGKRSGGNDIQNLERQRGQSQLVAEKEKVTSVEEFRVVAHQRSWSSRIGAEERECARWNEV